MRGANILVTGGTGSFGKKFIETILLNYPDVNKVIVYSRDELKQYEMSLSPIFKKHSAKLRFFIGDVRDKERLIRACEGVDYIIHAAALKQVPAAEYNPMECIKTNVLGAENVVDAALVSNVKKVVALSTDKACAPVNLYGATKLCSDKLFVAANNMKGSRELCFSVVRYGNVMGSRGSVIPLFQDKAKSTKTLPITDTNMTRFNITLSEGVDMVLYALNNAWGGEIFVPKIPSYRITDVAKAVVEDCELDVIGIRPGEKLHEEMISETDAFNTLDCGKYYVICPSVDLWDRGNYMKEFNGKEVPKGFKYNSGENTEWLDIPTLKDLIQEHCRNES